MQLVRMGVDCGPDFYGIATWPAALRLAFLNGGSVFVMDGWDGNSLATLTDQCPTAKTSEVFSVMTVHVPSPTPCPASRTLVRFRFWSSNCIALRFECWGTMCLGTRCPTSP